ncbi:MAG: hypothetical protein V1742_11995, partial [Pseudomonadota bacterium]
VEYRSGLKMGQPVLPLDFLAQGDRINLPANSTLILNYFASGVREQLAGPGTITIGENGSRLDGAADMKTSETVFRPPDVILSQFESLHIGAIALKSASSTPQLNIFTNPLKPDKTAVVSLNPVFSWKRLPAADKYRLRVSEAKGVLKLDVTVNADRYQHQSAFLDPGQEYSWTVEALEAKPPVTVQGSFRVLSLDQVKDLQEKESRIKTAYGPDSTETLVSLALLYKSFGLEAETANILKMIQQRRNKKM